MFSSKIFLQDKIYFPVEISPNQKDDHYNKDNDQQPRYNMVSTDSHEIKIILSGEIVKFPDRQKLDNYSEVMNSFNDSW